MDASSPTPRKAALVFVLVTAWIDVLSWGMTIPVYPLLFQRFTGGDVAQAATLVGVFMTMFAGVQLFAAPMLGALSDAYGRRAVILLACAGLALDLLAMAFAPNVWWLLATRIVHAVTAASFSAANAYVADVTAPEERARAYGLMSAAFGFGFIVGPGLGGVLGQIDLRLPFLVGAALAGVNAVYGYFVLPESLPRERRTPFAWRSAHPLAALAFLRADRGLLFLSFVNFLFQLAHQLYPSVWVIYTAYRYGWDSFMVGVTLMLSGLLSMLSSAFLVQPLVSRLGERNALVFGLMAWAIGMGVGAMAPTGWIFLFALPFGALSGVGPAALNAMLSQRVAAEAQGRLQGANSAIMSLTGLLGPLVFTSVFAFAAARFTPDHVLAGAPFFLGVAILLAAAGLALGAGRFAARAAAVR